MFKIPMIIEKLPGYEELIRILSEEGKVSFIIDRKHKRRFRNLIERLNKLEKLFKSNRTIFNKVKIYIYGIYVGLLQIILTTSSNNLSNAVNVYQVAWRHIANIDGEDVSDKEIMVTYNGK